jgi:hypothetical protein
VAESLLSSFGYGVFFASTAQMLRTDILKTQPNVFVTKSLKSGSLNKYYTGVFSSYQQAAEARLDLLKKGILNAKVVPFIEGREINNEELDQLILKYPDLKNYKNSLPKE